MRVIIKILLSILLIIINNAGYTIPFEILKSCINNKAYSNSIKFSRLSGTGEYGGDDIKINECKNVYTQTYKNHLYGTIDCDDKLFFIIMDKKIDPSKAKNFSINPEIKPGNFFSNTASWFKIIKDLQEFICIDAPLTESGTGAGLSQYYIIENAFDDKKDPIIYYYFFEKNIIPIDSPNL